VSRHPHLFRRCPPPRFIGEIKNRQASRCLAAVRKVSDQVHGVVEGTTASLVNRVRRRQLTEPSVDVRNLDV
jgi:hypothetical protein